MKALKALLFLIAITFFCHSSDAQAEGKKTLVFEFTVTGMKSADDAAKLDSVYMTKKGIHSCKTNFETKKIKVTCEPFFDFDTIKSVLIVLGFETPDKNIKATEQIEIK